MSEEQVDRASGVTHMVPPMPVQIVLGPAPVQWDTANKQIHQMIKKLDDAIERANGLCLSLRDAQQAIIDGQPT